MNINKCLHSTFVFLGGVITLLVSISPLHAEVYPSGASSSSEWKFPSGTPEGTRFSSLGADPTNLNQINPDNAGQLALNHKIVPTNVGKGHQGQPLVVNISKTSTPKMMMFVVTPWPNNLEAIDMTGKVVWTFNPGASENAIGIACCDVVSRGASYSKGKVLYTALDGTTVAVDAVTGKSVWKRTGLADLKAGETITGAPIVVEGVTVGSKVTDVLIIGNAGAEMGVRGWVQALDINNKGATVWKYYNTGSDADVGIIAGSIIPNIESTLTPEELVRYRANDASKLTTKDLGCTTWGDLPSSGSSSACTGLNKWKQGGATVWAWITQDPQAKVVYYGTANPGVWNPTMRPGSNKWSSSIIARDAATGKIKWVNQLTPHDGWDYDSMNESILITDNTLPASPVKQLVHFDKNGFVYKFNAVNGSLINASPFVNVTWVKRLGDGAIDYDANGMPQVDQTKMPVEGKLSPLICPAPLGGKEFAPAAYSPATGNFYVPAINFCVNHFTIKADYIAGAPFMGDALNFVPDFDTVTAPVAPTPSGVFRSFGEVVAWNVNTNAKSWSLPESAPLWGGFLVTASNVAFYGTLDKHFRAIDVNHPTNTDGSPKYLLDVSLECGVEGNPITYLGDDGKQKVAVFTGVGWLPGGFVGGGCPTSSFESDGGSGGTGNVHIFSLP